MKKIFIILFISNVFTNTLSSQTLLQQIEQSYNSLDTASYIENMILSYRVDLVVIEKEPSLDSLIVRPTYNHLSSIQRKNIIDSLMKNMSLQSKIIIADHTNSFVSEVKGKPVHYVLRLLFEKHEQSDPYSFFQPDTSELPFNLISFDKHLKPQFYVYVVEGRYIEYHGIFPTFSSRAGKNVLKIYRKILRKNPKYLLKCDGLEGGNTIWYVLNDEIYVYRILQMKEYKLDDYIKKFILTK